MCYCFYCVHGVPESLAEGKCLAGGDYGCMAGERCESFEDIGGDSDCFKEAVKPLEDWLLKGGEFKRIDI